VLRQQNEIMKNIECEIRSFITKEQFEKLLNFFILLRSDEAFTTAKTMKERLEGQADEQVTCYLKREGEKDCDLRIQQNKDYSKIWMKKGKVHDESREEIEIRFAREDFKKLEKLFLMLGYEVEIKWFRTRRAFKWNDIDVCLDYTRGYGYIIELEKIYREEEKGVTGIKFQKERDSISYYLKSKMAELGVALTPREEFDSKYIYYKENWKKLTIESSF
jgi:predicted adenylyl cyclase CyaB